MQLPTHSATIDILPGIRNGMQSARQEALALTRALTGGRGLKTPLGLRATASGQGWEGATTRSKAGGSQAPMRGQDGARLTDPINRDGVDLVTPLGLVRVEASALNRDRRGYQISIWLP